MAKPIKRPFSDSYLLAYSAEHIAYEIDHFFWLAKALGGKRLTLGAPSAQDGIRLNNVLIEGFVIHLRNVIDFLYFSPQPTDVGAVDFFPEGDWDKICPAISPTLLDARTRANKEVAHLTTERIAGGPPAKKGWNFEALANEIRPLLQLVSSKALPSRLAPNVAGVIR